MIGTTFTPTTPSSSLLLLPPRRPHCLDLASNNLPALPYQFGPQQSDVSRVTEHVHVSFASGLCASVPSVSICYHLPPDLLDAQLHKDRCGLSLRMWQTLREGFAECISIIQHFYSVISYISI